MNTERTYMIESPPQEDAVWAYLLMTRLMRYIEPAREWWSKVEELAPKDTGVYMMDGPPGMFYRFTRTAVRSPVRGVQAFPFVQTSFLQIIGVQGGSTKMIDRVCLNDRFVMDEFTIVCKSNLPSTVQQGQFLAIIPTEILARARELGVWLYMTRGEVAAISEGRVTKELVTKAKLKLYGG